MKLLQLKLTCLQSPHIFWLILCIVVVNMFHHGHLLCANVLGCECTLWNPVVATLWPQLLLSLWPPSTFTTVNIDLCCMCPTEVACSALLSHSHYQQDRSLDSRKVVVDGGEEEETESSMHRESSVTARHPSVFLQWGLWFMEESLCCKNLSRITRFCSLLCPWCFSYTPILVLLISISVYSFDRL